ncbi:DinB family protein [Aquimarina agarilytica]|uniref:DinB family protein n=1 Tax=Aquimarina agarilytica TaxID=1087449 RepID=UPI0002883697|nr:DinB family protein [Aquimarina agarilytica]
MENLKRALEITKVSRKVHFKILDHYTLEQLNFVPEGFKNNLFWNIAHIVVTQQLLVYRLSGLDTVVDEEWIELYRKGSSTKRDATEKELEELKVLLFATIDDTEKAIEEGLFKNYEAYMTSTGFELKNVNDAFEFNNFHEGIHLGYILALKKAIS